MKYTNPVLCADYSDPDVIRIDKGFLMVASSFNRIPAVPVLYSENLVEWKLVNYVSDRLPFDRYDKVCHGCGAWAPAVRFHGGKYYCLIPFPDEGIYVSETDDPFGKWSPLRPLMTGAGFEDPCPIWADGKCYIVFAFAKSRAGFNSTLAIIEADENLTCVSGSYTPIYDGYNHNPKIEGPKIFRRGKYYYILAAAGGVKSGWQTMLRSENIFGPYESKIILAQGDTDINGPHQGSLVELDGDKWAFIHFQDRGAFGRVIHVQPAIWRDEWLLCGKVTDEKLFGEPVEGGEYPVDVKTGFKIEPSDDFDKKELSPVWQNPANRRKEWYELKNGLKLNCAYYGGNAVSDLPQLFLEKIYYENFNVKTKCKLNLVNDGDETGFIVYGRKYMYACAETGETISK